jgi:hypothetical protein
VNRLAGIGVPLFSVRFTTFRKPLSMRIPRGLSLETRMNTRFSDPLPPEDRMEPTFHVIDAISSSG